MAAALIDGKALAAEVRARVRTEVEELRAAGVQPGLAVILVGEDPASQVYVRNKERACADVGIRSFIHRLPASTTQEGLLALIGRLNADPAVHGVLVQVPLPEGLSASLLQQAIDPAKDVDGFHPLNAGRLLLGQPGFVPCTPAGILELIKSTGVALAGREAVVVGRSATVGKPTAALLLAENATVTVCHSKTRDLAEVCRRAEVLVVAVGRRELVKGDWIRPGAVVIDVGINRDGDRLYGDVEFAAARERAGFLTPVPGGVGPMTVAMLMANTVKAARLASGLAPGGPAKVGMA
ncbi:MAG TPA: bifunctional methylenetetrahydrofolate dehydrogenase/methenyltetrahydrofolate cyclohydrolase FolD [Firmicutes bacterium]|nr:bifunctional methylenetetrahydrofolate dehydrogenase/methenyltetrahydrofolate cyclohydrolase FolD [Bacillota bacterium]